MIFKKTNFYKVIYNDDKTFKIVRIKNIDNENILINPNHIFIDKKGNRYILTTNQSAETINPLDFDSKFSPKEFKNAIESKLVSDLFRNFDENKLSIEKILLFVNIFISFMILYFIIIN